MISKRLKDVVLKFITDVDKSNGQRVHIYNTSDISVSGAGLGRLPTREHCFMLFDMPIFHCTHSDVQ